MAYVVLNSTINSNEYARGGYTIREQEFNHCYIFKRYEHTPTRPLGVVEIYVYEKYRSIFGNFVTIRPSISSAPYKKASFEKAHVYYNKHETKTPLLLVLYFKGVGSDAKIRYYRRSSFAYDISKKKYRAIEYLTAFTNGQDESQLVQPLLEESEKYINIYAYQIEKTVPSKNYNITISGKENIRVKQGGDSHGFHFYIHAPNESLKNKKAYVLYKQQVLLYWSPKPRPGRPAQIDQTQNIDISDIKIFFGSKFQEPIMIHVNTKDKHLYFFHKITNKSLYWQSLDDKAFNNLLGQKVGSSDIHSKLVASEYKLLIDALKKIELLITRILIIIVDMTNNYLEKDVNNALKDTDFDTQGCRLANSKGNVGVRNVSSQCNIISSKGYTIQEHDFTNILNSLQDNELFILKFIGSRAGNVTQHKTMVTIDLEYQRETGGYNSHSHYISVSNAQSIKHNYKWFRHSSEKNITDKNFVLHFNGQYVTVQGDSSDYELNRRVIMVYFEYFYRDAFVFVGFPNRSFTNTKILTYSTFKSSAVSGSAIKLSQLERITANVESRFELEESGYKIDQVVLDRLIKEYEQLKSDSLGLIYNLEYVRGQDKLYVYSSTSSSQILMICYNDKAYTRYYLGRYKSSWKQVSEITRCLCNSNSDRQDTSDRRVLESLAKIDTLVKIKDFNEPEETHDLKELRRMPIIDISRIDSSDDLFGISVSAKHTFVQSNLFVYFTHTPKGEIDLTIKSLITTIPATKNITLKQSLTSVKSVTVYFNTFIITKPLVLCIRTGNGQESYYKDLIRDEPSYSITKDSQISSENLCDKLFEENDNINESFTYQIDKTISTVGNTIKYGNEGSITVDKEENPKGITIYTHKPTDKKPRKSYVLQNRNLLIGRSDKKTSVIEHSYGKLFNTVKVYSLTKEKNYMLLIEFHESSFTYYAFKKDGSGSYWGKDNLSSKDHLSLKNKLDEINYFLRSSVIIEIDKRSDTQAKNDTEYPMKLIENKLNPDGNYEKSKYNEGRPVDRVTIKATVPSLIHETSVKMTQSGYNYVKHEIPNSSELSSLGSISANIVGIRLFLGKSTPTQSEEVFLYSNDEDAKQSKNRLNLYYYLSSTSTSTSKIVVFFHGEDSRPLVICINDKIYKPRDNKSIEWVFFKDVGCHQTSQILDTLKNVYKGMKKKITFVKDGGDQNISPSHRNFAESYRKTTYSPDYSRTQEGPFVLSMSTLTESMSNSTMVAKLFDALYKGTFNTIAKYYKDNAKPLLFEFADESGNTHIVKKDDIKYWSKEKVNDVQEALKNIESSVDKTTVYEIDQMSSDYSTKINLNPIRKSPTNDFTKYIHTPLGQTSTKSIILYNLSKLEKNNEPLKEIEDQTYKSVVVYFGTRAMNGDKAAPLILELSSTDNKKLYKHKFEKSSSNWETVEIPPNDTNDRQLIEKLKETELDMVESVVVLLEKSDKEDYGNDEIRNAVTQHKPPKQYNLASIDSKTIRVRYKTISDDKSIRDSGYICCEHDLSSCFKGMKNYGLRFYILTGESTDKYKEIKLCNSDDSIETLYYDNDAHTEKNKVYVFFYSKDPRPLLACYNGKAYRPKSKDEYEIKWIREKKITKCLCDNTYYCSDLLSILTDVSKILNVVFLDKRPTVLRPEKETPDSPGTIDHKYCLQKFKNKDIDVKVTYRNKKCYRVYNYEPYGSDGQGGGYRLGNIKYGSSADVNGLNYESYKPLSTVSVYYSVYDEKHEHPFLVSLGFKTNDESTYEFYKLREKGGKEWEKMKDSGDHSGIVKKLKETDTFEDGLYDLRNKLDIEFKDEEKNKITPLFKTDECTEDKSNIAAIAGGTVGTAAVVGTGITIGVVVAKKLAAAAFVAAVS